MLKKRVPCIFSNLQNAFEVTGTFKQMKVKLAEDGFNPDATQDRLFYLEESQGYVPMTLDIYRSITDGKIRL